MLTALDLQIGDVLVCLMRSRELMHGCPCSAMLDVFDADRGVPRSALGPAAGGPSMRDLAAVSPADIDKVQGPHPCGEKQDSHAVQMAEVPARARHNRIAARAGWSHAHQATGVCKGVGSGCECGQVKYVFKNLVRDWSEEGAAERAQSYGRMLTELRARLPLPPPPLPVTANASSHQQQQQPPPRVLVPGAGQGRLCLETAIQVAWNCCRGHGKLQL
jgi:N2227-like protein